MADAPSQDLVGFQSEATDNEEEIDCNKARITVLAKGHVINYVIPSFPVFETRLVKVKLQWINSCGELEVFDCFARDCAALNHALPADLIVPYNCQYAFVIEVGQLVILQNNTAQKNI